MTTQKNVSVSNPTAPSSIGTKTNYSSLAMGVVLALILIGAAILFSKPTIGTSAIESRAAQAWTARYQGLAGQATRLEEANRVQGFEAWAARYQGLANRYAPVKASAARYQRMADYFATVDASAARYQGLANLYNLEDGTISQRVLAAWAARYEAMAGSYARTNEPISHQGLDAWAARYQAMANFSTSGN
jgi:hypothetical protein